MMPCRQVSRRLAEVILCAGLAQGCGSSGGGDDEPPAVGAPAAAVVEGDSGSVTLQFELSLSRAADAAVSVDYATADVSANAGSDYQAAQGRVEFAAGVTRATLGVTVYGDADVEADETFALELSNPVNATLGDREALGTIVDDDAVAGPPGLDARPGNLTCTAPPRALPAAGIEVDNPYPDPAINFNQPTKLLLEPVADPRWFVLEKGGVVMNFDPDDPDSDTLATFLDISTTVYDVFEAGLLGMAFHPDYPATAEVFLSYTRRTGGQTQSVISRFTLDSVVSPGGGTIEEVLLLVDQDEDNHNGGDIAFGADGLLYIGLGDGGGDRGSSQDTTRLLGSMLRIDVTDPLSAPYDIPGDNPFDGNAPCGPSANADDCPEIYAWGFRNPWRWTFDPVTGELWLADVGQQRYEEVNRVTLGGNYGWPCREGMHDFDTCAGSFVEPEAEYDHLVGGGAITGGAVYRGSAIAGLAGRYLFGDSVSGRIYALESDGAGGYTVDELLDTPQRPTSFAIGPDGELYYTDIASGELGKLLPAAGGGGDTIPALLSDSGCTDPADVTRPYAGLVPYDLQAPFWSDGAAKERFIGLPDGTAITNIDDDYWDFPPRTVLVKNFRIDGKLIETRHLMRHPDGSWAGYTYEWNDAQTEAFRVEGGKTADKDGQDWIYPSEAQCMECHTGAAGFSLGPETAQLNGRFSYPQTGRDANQLETLDHIAMFSAPLAAPVAILPALPDPADAAAPLAERSRAWLHTNCAQCHRAGGPTPANIDLRYDTPLGATQACDVAPSLGDLGIAGARLIAPGDAARSILVARAGRRDADGMPPLGSNAVDVAGVALLAAWIDGLNACP